MDPTTASLIGAGIGALAGLTGGWLNGWRQSKLEYEKWTRSRQDTLEKDTRLALADLTKRMAAGTHAIAWLTWKAKHELDRFSENDLTAYDATMKTLFPEIVGSRVALAALNKEIHDQVSPWIEGLYELDVKTAKAAALYRNTVLEGAKVLAECHGDTLKFDKLFLEEVTRMGIREEIAVTSSRA